MQDRVTEGGQVGAGQAGSEWGRLGRDGAGVVYL